MEDGPTRLNRPAMRTAAVLSWMLGLGFGLPCVYGIWHLARRGEIATFLGFPTYGRGPFESAGVPTTIPLLTAFLMVCSGELALGWLLWRQRRGGAVLAIVLFPLEMVFWVGFALPFGPVAGVPRTIAVLVALRSQARTAAGGAEA